MARRARAQVTKQTFLDTTYGLRECGRERDPFEKLAWLIKAQEAPFADSKFSHPYKHEKATAMNDKIQELLTRLKQIEHEFEEEVEAGRAQFRYRISQGQIIFEQGIASEHRRLKIGIIRFLRTSSIGTLIIAPFVYGLIVPLIILDLSLWIYQKVCFSVWGMAPVKRSEYFVVDRHHLGYLNSIQKLNCVYCSYATGMIAYAQEVAARTEQFWCPIKHAVRTKSPHERYRRFLDYGDAQAFSARLEELRDQVRHSNDL